MDLLWGVFPHFYGFLSAEPLSYSPTALKDAVARKKRSSCSLRASRLGLEEMRQYKAEGQEECKQECTGVEIQTSGFIS